MKKLAEFDENINIEMINKICSVLQTIGEVRNKGGDISHGKHTPKDYVSDYKLALFIYQTTEALAFYILSSFFALNLSFLEITPYEDNPQFNDMLDEEVPLEGRVLWSKSLYDQDYIAYKERLDEYLADVAEYRKETY